MAKQLKVIIKNTQLAEAFKQSKKRSDLPSLKEKRVEKEAEPPAIPESTDKEKELVSENPVLAPPSPEPLFTPKSVPTAIRAPSPHPDQPAAYQAKKLYQAPLSQGSKLVWSPKKKSSEQNFGGERPLYSSPQTYPSSSNSSQSEPFVPKPLNLSLSWRPAGSSSSTGTKPNRERVEGIRYKNYSERRSAPFSTARPNISFSSQDNKTIHRSSTRFQDDKEKRSFKEEKDLKTQKKTEVYRVFDSRDKQGLRNEEEEAWKPRKIRRGRSSLDQEEITIRPKVLSIRLPIMVKDLAAQMKLKASQLISKLFMKGVLITLNDYLDDETTIQLLGQDFDCEISIDIKEEKRIQITDKTVKQEIEETAADQLLPRNPVVAFMGHVDHGKTSLIDRIRKSNRVSGEAGSITQHIAAFRYHTKVGDLTILDTPGHEAFSTMRTRGANVTDIVIIVIAGDEGVREQTVEAINQAKAAQVPMLIAINKSDKPNFNPEPIYRELAKLDLLPEVWGGKVVTLNCSALTGDGVENLLEMIALQSEILELKANPDTRARGSVIESENNKGLGAVATVLVQNGSLHIGDAIVFAEHWGRVKTMHDENNRSIDRAGPATPAKITGLSGIPEAGSEFIVVENEKSASELSEKRSTQRKRLNAPTKPVELEGFLQKQIQKQAQKTVNLILRADVQGSLEALKHSLEKIESSKVRLHFVSALVGEISESDISLAAAAKAKIIGFHTQIESHAEPLIKELKIEVKLHDIIYHAVEDVKKLMIESLDKIVKEEATGQAIVKAVFKASQLGRIAGCQMSDGFISRSSHIRLVRDGAPLETTTVGSLKRVKEDVREVSKGQEFGLLLQGFSDFKEGDLLYAFDIKYLTPDL